jgi:hypothetical protein
MILPPQPNESEPEFPLAGGSDNRLIDCNRKGYVGMLKFQFYPRSRNHRTLTANPAATNRQILNDAFISQLLQRGMQRPDPHGKVDGDPIKIAPWAASKATEKGTKTLRTELAAKGIDRRPTKEPIRCRPLCGKPCLRRATSRTHDNSHSANLLPSAEWSLSYVLFDSYGYPSKVQGKTL